MKSTDSLRQEPMATLLPAPVYSKPPPIFHIIRRCPPPATPTVRKIFKIEKAKRFPTSLTNQYSQSLTVGKKNLKNKLLFSP